MFARNILISAKELGLKVFPDYYTSWHFDDKISENYLLEAAGSKIPNSWIFYSYEEANNWIDNLANFPIIGKLRCGSGSSNVKLVANKKEALKYSSKMFGRGRKYTPNLLFKASSNIKSARSLKTIIGRVTRIPDFFEPMNKSKDFPNEKGYVYFQEFIPNEGFDLKVVVVNNKMSFIVRYVRNNDFRASGGGSLHYDKSLITKNIIDSSFKTSNKLKFQCMGYDYVIDSRDGVAKIIEMSYGFSHIAIIDAEGYWDKDGNWFNEPLNVPNEVIKSLIEN